MTERIVWVLAVLLVGAAAFFGGQQLGISQGEAARAAAQQGFFSQRGGAQGGQGGQSGQRGQGVSGTVESVGDGSLVLSTLDGSKFTVTLAPGAAVHVQSRGQLSDIKPGERVVVVGQRSGDSITATDVQSGGGGRPGQQQGAP